MQRLKNNSKAVVSLSTVSRSKYQHRRSGGKHVIGLRETFQDTIESANMIIDTWLKYPVWTSFNAALHKLKSPSCYFLLRC
jgi:hypothetical protein